MNEFNGLQHVEGNHVTLRDKHPQGVNPAGVPVDKDRRRPWKSLDHEWRCQRQQIKLRPIAPPEPRARGITYLLRSHAKYQNSFAYEHSKCTIFIAAGNRCPEERRGERRLQIYFR